MKVNFNNDFYGEIEVGNLIFYNHGDMQYKLLVCEGGDYIYLIDVETCNVFLDFNEQFEGKKVHEWLNEHGEIVKVFNKDNIVLSLS